MKLFINGWDVTFNYPGMEAINRKTKERQWGNFWWNNKSEDYRESKIKEYKDIKEIFFDYCINQRAD